MLSSNFNYIELQGDHCDFICSSSITVGQAKNVTSLIKLNFSQVQGGVAIQIIVKAPQDTQIIASYVGAMVVAALQ